MSVRRNLAILTLFCLVSGPTSLYAKDLSGAEVTLPPAPQSETMQDVAQRTYELSLEQVLPMTPEQIQAYLDRMKQTSEAIRDSEPPKMCTRTERLMLQPGATPPTVHIVPGYVSTVTFFDATGSPWPITSVTEGNSKWFSVQKPEDLEPGNMLTVSALARHAHSNITVTLKDETTPVVVRLTTDDRNKGAITDSLISFQADKRGPNASDPMVGRKLKSVVSSNMLSFLDGVPPSGAVRMALSPSKDGVALWKLDKHLYLRTKYAAVWPAWSDVLSGTADYRVYELPIVPSIIVSIGGHTETLSIDEF